MNQEPYTSNQPNGETSSGNTNDHYYTAPEYGQPGGDPYAPPPAPRGRGFATASLVLGIISLVCCCLGPFAFVLAVLAVVFACLSRRGAGMFNGMAVAGLILGILGLVASGYMFYGYVISFSDPEFWAMYEEAMKEILQNVDNDAALALLCK